MPVGKYVIYKCPKCGYKVTKFQGDVLYSGFDICPKCGSKMKVISSSFNMPIGSIIVDIFRKIFKV